MGHEGEDPWNRPGGWVPPPFPVGAGEEVAHRTRRGRGDHGRWELAAAVFGILCLLSPVVAVAAIVYYARTAPPPPEGDGPEEAWLEFAIIFWALLVMAGCFVLAVGCLIAGGLQDRRRAREQRRFQHQVPRW